MNEFHQRIVVVMDWTEDNRCTAKTYGHHSLQGIQASGPNPATCMSNLARAWREDDRRQAISHVIDDIGGAE